MQYPIADRIFYNGPIYTMEDDLKKAEAVGIFQDKIVFVGPKEQAKQYADENTQWIDLKAVSYTHLSATWKQNTTVPCNSSLISLKAFAVPNKIAAWPSCPQACITPSFCD